MMVLKCIRRHLKSTQYNSNGIRKTSNYDGITVHMHKINDGLAKHI